MLAGVPLLCGFFNLKMVFGAIKLDGYVMSDWVVGLPYAKCHSVAGLFGADIVEQFISQADRVPVNLRDKRLGG